MRHNAANVAAAATGPDRKGIQHVDAISGRAGTGLPGRFDFDLVASTRERRFPAAAAGDVAPRAIAGRQDVLTALAYVLVAEVDIDLALRACRRRPPFWPRSTPQSSFPPAPLRSPAAFLPLLELVREASRVYRMTDEDVIVAGDDVLVRYTATATHQGEWMGIAPTCPSGCIPALSLYRLQNNLIVDAWERLDLLHLV